MEGTGEKTLFTGGYDDNNQQKPISELNEYSSSYRIPTVVGTGPTVENKTDMATKSSEELRTMVGG